MYGRFLMNDGGKEYYDELLKNAEEEIPQYYYEANEIFGLVIITICGIIISSNNPFFYWMYSLPFIIGLLLRMWYNFPPSLIELRKERKKIHNLYDSLGKNEYLTPKLQSFEKKHFGYRSFLTGFILYTFGAFTYLMIGAVILFPEWGQHILNVKI